VQPFPWKSTVTAIAGIAVHKKNMPVASTAKIAFPVCFMFPPLVFVVKTIV
jgi:hypothetical protein